MEFPVHLLEKYLPFLLGLIKLLQALLGLEGKVD
jgi:hypothetical protein